MNDWTTDNTALINEMKERSLHIPVMPKEVRESLALKPGAIVVDCTLGLGGHALLLLQDMGEGGRYIGIDRDSESLKLAASISKPKQRSKLILASSYSNEMPFSIGNYLQNRAPILVPAYPNQSPNKLKDLTRGIWGLTSGLFPMEELITHEYKLEKITNAFEDCITRKNGYIKGIILPHD